MSETTTLHTNWGNAKVNNHGYYQITSKIHNGKLLHRLIYESVWGKIPEGYVIHHIDGDKTNNCILNLLIVDKEHHSSLHNKGRALPFELCKQRSINNSSTGYYRVTKDKTKYCKKGFIWLYQYRVNGKFKKIRSVDINKLEEKVKSKGLPWFKFGEVEV